MSLSQMGFMSFMSSCFCEVVLGLEHFVTTERSARVHCSICQSQVFFNVYYCRNIKRIVFNTLLKYDGTSTVLLTSSQVKQIAGRAGRYGSDHPEGEATA